MALVVVALVATAVPGMSDDAEEAPSEAGYLFGGDLNVAHAFYCSTDDLGFGVGGCTVACPGEGGLCTIVVDDDQWPNPGFSWRCTHDPSIGMNSNHGSRTFENVCPKGQVDVTPWWENSTTGIIRASAD